MKKIKSIVCLVLVFLILGSLCACGDVGDSKDEGESVEGKIRNAVTSKASLEFFGSAIGGNELKSSKATVSTVRKVNETEYKVSGKMVMIDVYGTEWSNNFDCEVTLSAGEVKVGSFEYTGSKWNKN